MLPNIRRPQTSFEVSRSPIARRTLSSTPSPPVSPLPEPTSPRLTPRPSPRLAPLTPFVPPSGFRRHFDTVMTRLAPLPEISYDQLSSTHHALSDDDRVWNPSGDETAAVRERNALRGHYGHDRAPLRNIYPSPLHPKTGSEIPNPSATSQELRESQLQRIPFDARADRQSLKSYKRRHELILHEAARMRFEGKSQADIDKFVEKAIAGKARGFKGLGKF